MSIPSFHCMWCPFQQTVAIVHYICIMVIVDNDIKFIKKGTG